VRVPCAENSCHQNNLLPQFFHAESHYPGGQRRMFPLLTASTKRKDRLCGLTEYTIKSKKLPSTCTEYPLHHHIKKMAKM
jgi:hypothetical protein